VDSTHHKISDRPIRNIRTYEIIYLNFEKTLLKFPNVLAYDILNVKCETMQVFPHNRWLFET